MSLIDKTNKIYVKSFYISLLYQLIYPGSVNGMENSSMQEVTARQQAKAILEILKNLSSQGKYDEITNELKRLNEEFSSNTIKVLNEAVLKLKNKVKDKLKATNTQVTKGWQDELNRLINNDDEQRFETFRMNYEGAKQYWQNLPSKDQCIKYVDAIQADVSSFKDLQHAFFKHFFHPFLVLPIVQSVVNNNKDQISYLLKNRNFSTQNLDSILQADGLYQKIRTTISNANNSGHPCKIFDLPMIAIRTSFWREISQYLDPNNPEHCFYFSALITYWLVSNFKNLTGMICVHTPHSDGNNNPPLLSFNFYTHDIVPCVGNNVYNRTPGIFIGNNEENSHIFFVLHRGETFATVYPILPQETDNKLDKSVLATVYPTDVVPDNFYVNLSKNSTADIVYDDSYSIRASLNDSNCGKNYKKTSSPQNHNTYNQRKGKETPNPKKLDPKKKTQPQQEPRKQRQQELEKQRQQELEKQRQQEEKKILDGLSKNINKIGNQLKKLKSTQKTAEIKEYIKNPFSIIPPNGLAPKIRYEMILKKGEELLKLAKQATSSQTPIENMSIDSAANVDDKTQSLSLSTKNESAPQTTSTAKPQTSAVNPPEENNELIKPEDLFNTLEELNLKLSGEKKKTIDEWIANVLSKSTEDGEKLSKTLNDILSYLCDIAEEIPVLAQEQNNSKKKSKKPHESENSKSNKIMEALSGINKRHSQCHKELKEIGQTTQNFLNNCPELAVLLSSVKSLGEPTSTFSEIYEQISEINRQIDSLSDSARTGLVKNESNSRITRNLEKISGFIKDKKKLDLLKKLIPNHIAGELAIFDYFKNLPSLQTTDVLQEIMEYNSRYLNPIKTPKHTSKRKKLSKTAHTDTLSILDRELEEIERDEKELDRKEMEAYENCYEMACVNAPNSNFFTDAFVDAFSDLTSAEDLIFLYNKSTTLANMLDGLEAYCEIFHLAQTKPKQNLSLVMKNIGNDQMLNAITSWSQSKNTEYKILEAAQYITLTYVLMSVLGVQGNPILPSKAQSSAQKNKFLLPLFNIIPEDEIRTVVNSDILIKNDFFEKYKNFFYLLFEKEIDAKIKTNTNCTYKFLELAIDFLDPYFLLHLLELGADPNQLDKDKETPLQITISKVRDNRIIDPKKKMEILDKIQKMAEILISRGAFYGNPQNSQTKEPFFSDSSEIPLVEMAENPNLFAFFFPIIKNDKNLKQNLLSIHMENAKKIYTDQNQGLSELDNAQFKNFLECNEKFDKNKDHMSLLTYIVWRSVETLTSPQDCSIMLYNLLSNFDPAMFLENGFKDHLFIGKLMDLAALQSASIKDTSFLKEPKNWDFLSEKGGIASYINQYASQYMKMKDDSSNRLSLNTVIQYADLFIKSNLPEEIKIELVDSFPNLHTLIGYTENDEYRNTLSQLLTKYIDWLSDPNIPNSIKEKLKRNTEKL